MNRVPLNWMMSMLLLSPFSYIHARFVVRRFQKVTRNSYNVIYNSVLSGKNNRSKLDDEFILISCCKMLQTAINEIINMFVCLFIEASF